MTTSLHASLPRTLQTARLDLELWNDSDEHIDCALTGFNSPTALARQGDFGLKTHEDMHNLVKGTKFKSNDLVPGKIPDCGIVYMLRLEGKLIGCISLVQRTSDIPPDMGWMILEPWMGQGYATEGAKAVLKLVTEDLGMTRLVASLRKDNSASVRVCEKLGLERGPDVKKSDSDIPYVA